MAPVVGRIRKRSSFRALAKPAGRAAHGPVAVAYSQVEAEFGAPMVAYAVGRTVGTAVVRNRVRRRLRAAVRAAAPSLPSGCYLVRATAAAAGASFPELDLAVRAAALGAAGRAGRHPSVGVSA
jgi:ribonuclease P protein component